MRCERLRNRPFVARHARDEHGALHLMPIDLRHPPVRELLRCAGRLPPESRRDCCGRIAHRIVRRHRARASRRNAARRSGSGRRSGACSGSVFKFSALQARAPRAPDAHARGIRLMVTAAPSAAGCPRRIVPRPARAINACPPRSAARQCRRRPWCVRRGAAYHAVAQVAGGRVQHDPRTPADASRRPALSVSAAARKRIL